MFKDRPWRCLATLKQQMYMNGDETWRRRMSGFIGQIHNDMRLGGLEGVKELEIRTSPSSWGCDTDVLVST